MYLLDSDICIEIMRGRLPVAQELMRKTSPELFGIPAIVEAELRYGAENSDNPEEGRYCVESLLAPLSIVPFDSRCAGFYAKLRADFKRRGSVIGPNDLLIAATALANGATLVTNNVREFSREGPHPGILGPGGVEAIGPHTPSFLSRFPYVGGCE